jgi:hypothetical protein
VKDNNRNLFIDNVNDYDEGLDIKIGVISFLSGLRIGNRAWGRSIFGLVNLIKNKRVNYISNSYRYMLQQYSVGDSRYYGSGNIMYKNEDLYNNQVLKISKLDSFNAYSILVFDKFRRHLAFDIHVYLQGGELVRVY